MNWKIEFLDEARKDLKRLDHSIQIQVVKGIKKVHSFSETSPHLFIIFSFRSLY